MVNFLFFFVAEKLWMNSQESPWRPTEDSKRDSRLRISPSKFLFFISAKSEFLVWKKHFPLFQ